MAAATKPARLRGVVLCASLVTKPIPWVPKLARHFSWPALIRQAHNAVPSPVMAARVRQVLIVDVSEELRCCPVPIFYLTAGSDRVVPRHNAKRIQRIRPDVEVRTIAGSHIALAANPVEAAAEIRHFACRCYTTPIASSIPQP